MLLLLLLLLAEMVPSFPRDAQSSQSFAAGRYRRNASRLAFSTQTSLAFEKAVERCLVSSVCCPGVCGLSWRLALRLAQCDNAPSREQILCVVNNTRAYL